MNPALDTTYKKDLDFEVEPRALILCKLRNGEQDQVTLLRQRNKKDGNGDDDDQHQLKLTRKNLSIFNKMARQSGTKKASVTTSSDPTDTSSAKTVSSTNPAFAMQLHKNGVLTPKASEQPANLEHLRERFASARKTPPPSEAEYKAYCRRVESARNEATLVFHFANTRLLKQYETNYEEELNHAFTGLPKDLGFNNGLSAPQPDFVQGLHITEFDPFSVDQSISGGILYREDPDSLALPHLAGEFKKPGRNMLEARSQAAYDGAALVYLRDEALSCIRKPDISGHAEITSFTTDGINLNTFAHYAFLSKDGKIKYHQYPIHSMILTNSYEDFVNARRALRNQQDYAREKSYALRDQLKIYWEQQHRFPRSGSP